MSKLFATDRLDVCFSLPKLIQLQRWGIDLTELLSKDCFRFHVMSDVQLTPEEKQKVHLLSPKKYIELIFTAWERNDQPTYPPTWEGLFTVLRKMDLDHLVEQITKCVTGSVREIDGQFSELDGVEGERGKGSNNHAL